MQLPEVEGMEKCRYVGWAEGRIWGVRRWDRRVEVGNCGKSGATENVEENE